MSDLLFLTQLLLLPLSYGAIRLHYYYTKNRKFKLLDFLLSGILLCSYTFGALLFICLAIKTFSYN